MYLVSPFLPLRYYVKLTKYLSSYSPFARFAYADCIFSAVNFTSSRAYRLAFRAGVITQRKILREKREVIGYVNFSISNAAYFRTCESQTGDCIEMLRDPLEIRKINFECYVAHSHACLFPERNIDFVAKARKICAVRKKGYKIVNVYERV